MLQEVEGPGGETELMVGPDEERPQDRPAQLPGKNVEGALRMWQGFPGGAVVKNPPASAGDTGSSPGPGRSHMPRSN